MGRCTSLHLLLLFAPLIRSTSLWAINPSSSGHFDLVFNGEAVLKKGCPSVIDSANSEKRMSLCGGAMTATTGAPQPGVDPKLGNFTATTLSYKSSGSSNGPGAAALEFKAFEAPSRVVHLRLRFATPTATNFVSPMSGAVWSIGAGLMTRVLNIPIDSDMQSMYASLPLVSGTSLYGTAVYDEKSRKGLVVGFLEHTLFKSGVEYGPEHINAGKSAK